jgi:hypothetical protein
MLWNGTSVFPVSSEGPPHLVASYDTRIYSNPSKLPWILFIISWIHHWKFYNISFGIKTKIYWTFLIEGCVNLVRPKAELRGSFLSSFLLIVNEFMWYNKQDPCQFWWKKNLSRTCQTNVFTYPTGGHDLCLSMSLIEVSSNCYWQVWTNYKSWLVT